MRRIRDFGAIPTFPEVFLIALLDFPSCSELNNKEKKVKTRKVTP